MAGLDNLAQSNEFRDLVRRVRQLETGTPMNASSVGDGGIRVHSGGVITIENGGLRVTGTAEIIGQLIASGSIFFNGPVRITGPLDITGLTQIMGDLILQSGGRFTAGTIQLNPDGSAKFGTLTIAPDGKLTSGKATINPDGSADFGTLEIGADGKLTSGAATINPDGSAKFGQFDIAKNGDLDSKGTLDIKGKSTLQDDLEVKNGGKVTVGKMRIDPSVASGALVFDNGGQLYSNADSLQLFVGGTAVQVSEAGASINHEGRAFSVDTTGRRIANLPTTTEKPNLYINSSGYLFRSTAE